MDKIVYKHKYYQQTMFRWVLNNVNFPFSNSVTLFCLVFKCVLSLLKLQIYYTPPCSDAGLVAFHVTLYGKALHTGDGKSLEKIACFRPWSPWGEEKQKFYYVPRVLLSGIHRVTSVSAFMPTIGFWSFSRERSLSQYLILHDRCLSSWRGDDLELFALNPWLPKYLIIFRAIFFPW